MQDVKRKSPEEIEELANTILQLNVDDISAIGSEEINSSSKHTDVFLDRAKVGDHKDLSNTIININAICGKENSGGSKLKALWNKAIKPIKDLKTNYSTMNEVLDKLINEVEKKGENIKENRLTMQNLADDIVKCYYSITDIISAMELSKNKLLENLSFLKEKQDELDEMDYQRSTKSVLFKINLLDKRIETLSIQKLTCTQTVDQIDLEVQTCKSLEDNFKSIRHTQMKIWKQGIALSISSEMNKEAIQLSNAISDGINSNYKQHALNVADNNKNAYELTNRPLLEIETIKDVEKILIKQLNDTANAVKKIEQQRNTRRIAISNANQSSLKFNYQSDNLLESK